MTSTFLSSPVLVLTPVRELFFGRTSSKSSSGYLVLAINVDLIYFIVDLVRADSCPPSSSDLNI
jgi:hypothetical protein